MSEYFRSFIKKEHYPVHPNSIRFKTNFTNGVFDVMKKRDWKETDSDLEWDIIWADKDWIHDVMDYIHLAPNQRVNHFRNHYELSRKDFLIKNLKRYKKQLKDAKSDEHEQINFFPQTYNLPSEYTIFKDEFSKYNKETIWIMKPVGRSQGKGIFLFDKLSQIQEWKSNFRYKPENPTAEPYIVQRYIYNPLTIGGKKFDLRIYV
jgi:tubulin polyglutamylase TTLL9